MKEILKKTGKVLLYVFLGLAILLIVIGIFIDPIVKDLIENRVSKSAKGQYEVSIEDADVSIFRGNLVLEGIRFKTDTSQADSPPIAFFTADKAGIKGLSWLVYLIDNRVRMDKILLENLNLQVFAKTLNNDKQSPPFRLEQLDFYPMIKKQVDRVFLKDLGLNKISFTLINMTTQDTLQFNADNLNLESDNILIDANKLITDSRALYATEIDFMGKDIKIERSGNEKLTAQVDTVSFGTDQNILSILTHNVLFFQNKGVTNDTALFVELQKFKLAELNLNSIQKENIAYLKTVNLSGIDVVSNTSPKPAGNSTQTKDSSQENKDFNLSTLSLGENLPELINEVRIEQLAVNNADFRLKDVAKVKNAMFQATDIVINKNSAFYENRFLHAQTVTSHIDSMTASVGKPQVEFNLSGFQVDINEGIGNLRFNKLTANVEKEAPETLWFDAAIGAFKIAGINTRELVEGRLSIDSIGILKPEFTAKLPTSKQQYSPPDLYPLIEGVLDRLSINKFALIEADLKINMVGLVKSEFRLPALYVQLSDILIAEGTAYTDDRVLHADNIAVRMENFKYFFPDEVYSLKVDLFRLSTEEKFIESKGLRYAYNDNYEKILRTPETNQVFEISNDFLRIDGIGFRQLIKDQNIIASEVKVADWEVSIFKNQNYQQQKKQKPSGTMPQKMLKQLENKIYIGNVNLESGFVSYKELASEADTAGVMVVSDIFVRAENITNYNSLLQKNPIMTLESGGMIMETGPFKTALAFHMLSNENKVEITGNIDSLDLVRLNKLTSYTTNLAIRSGELHKMDWEITADEEKAEGILTISYEDLKIKISESNEADTSGLFRGIGSYLANNLVLNTDTSADDPEAPKRVEIEQERNKEKGFVNYYVQSLMDGILEVVITVF